MDPNLIHWRKVETLRREDETPVRQSLDRPGSPYRPPSYATEDGVRYVMDAQPRSEPTPEQLPIHPSEGGRVASGMF